MRPDREARRAGAGQLLHEVTEVLQTVGDRSSVASGMVANVVAISSSTAAPSRPIVSALGSSGRSAVAVVEASAAEPAVTAAEAPGARLGPGGVVLEGVQRELPAAPHRGHESGDRHEAVSSGGPGVSSAPSSRGAFEPGGR